VAELPEHVRRNRAEWTEWAPDYAETAPAQWQTAELTWGVWGVPEAELRVLPERLEGLDTVELGCGTAYVSAWLARQGARPVGVDVTPAQLATAREMQAARRLRSGGELVFLVNGTLVLLCAPEEEEAPPGRALLRPYFGLHRLEWGGHGLGRPGAGADRGRAASLPGSPRS
jgi:hypothetical protein